MAPLEGPLWRAMFSIRCLGRSPAASNFTAMPSLWHASPGDCGPPRRFHVAFEDWITGSEWQLGGAFSHIHFHSDFPPFRKFWSTSKSCPQWLGMMPWLAQNTISWFGTPFVTLSHRISVHPTGLWQAKKGISGRGALRGSSESGQSRRLGGKKTAKPSSFQSFTLVKKGCSW